MWCSAYCIIFIFLISQNPLNQQTWTWIQTVWTFFHLFLLLDFLQSRYAWEWGHFCHLCWRSHRRQRVKGKGKRDTRWHSYLIRPFQVIYGNILLIYLLGLITSWVEIPVLCYIWCTLFKCLMVFPQCIQDIKINNLKLLGFVMYFVKLNGSGIA